MISVPVLCTGISPSPRSFHASVVIGDGLYIHGGIDKRNHVLSCLHRFDTKDKRWDLIATTPSLSEKKPGILACLEPCDAPSLSHHCAVPFGNKFIIIIGGWNGKKRTSNVFVFDTDEHSWNKMNVYGDIPVGLSSHTALLVSDTQILVIGREGGIHTHRKSGDAFTLNPVTGEYKQAMYGVDSRSGHSSSIVRSPCGKGLRVFVYSGRKTGRQYSFVGFWKDKYGKGTKLSDGIAGGLNDVISKCKTTDVPEGRQNSKAVCIDDQTVLIYGGQFWRARDFVTSEALVCNTMSMTWRKLPSSLPKLIGFTMDIACDGICYVFGGSDGKTSSNNLWCLHVSA